MVQWLEVDVGILWMPLLGLEGITIWFSARVASISLTKSGSSCEITGSLMSCLKVVSSKLLTKERSVSVSASTTRFLSLSGGKRPGFQSHYPWLTSRCLAWIRRSVWPFDFWPQGPEDHAQSSHLPNWLLDLCDPIHSSQLWSPSALE